MIRFKCETCTEICELIVQSKTPIRCPIYLNGKCCEWEINPLTFEEWLLQENINQALISEPELLSLSRAFHYNSNTD